MIQNARITSTTLGVNDHGIMDAWLMLDYGGSGQGFGGYALDEPLKRDGKFVRRAGTSFGLQFIMDLLATLEVESWEKLPGTVLRVRLSGDGFGGKIEAVGHYMKDQWFDPAALAKEMLVR